MGCEARAERMPVYSWTIRDPRRARRQLKFTPMRLSGKAMADREAEMVARIAPGVATLDAGAVGCAGRRRRPVPRPCLPAALEESGSVGAGTGWTPAADPGRARTAALIAAAPAYLKTHSQGEYVFDHGWADAWERAGGQYYPKLQVAVPFTPGAGPAAARGTAAAHCWPRSRR